MYTVPVLRHISTLSCLSGRFLCASYFTLVECNSLIHFNFHWKSFSIFFICPTHSEFIENLIRLFSFLRLGFLVTKLSPSGRMMLFLSLCVCVCELSKVSMCWLQTKPWMSCFYILADKHFRTKSFH